MCHKCFPNVYGFFYIEIFLIDWIVVVFFLAFYFGEDHFYPKRIKLFSSNIFSYLKPLDF